MADTKITALAAITTVDPAADVLPIVDISDTSMAASGTTKKITSNQILGSGGTATLASATITGDLTVRTNKLAVTSTGVGIGMTPITPLSGVIGTTGAIFFRTTDPAAAVATPYIQAPASTGFSSTSPAYGFWYQACGIGNPALNNVSIITDSAERYKIDSTGVSTWSVGGTTAMTLNATGLGIGVTPSAKLHVEGGGAQARFSIASASDARHEYYRNGIREGLITWDANVIGLYATQSSGEVVIASSNTIRVRVKTGGQVRFVPLASDPASAEAGDVYYNSSSNKLKCYNGSIWNDLF